MSADVHLDNANVALRAFDEELVRRVADARSQLSANDDRILEHLQGRLDEIAFHTSDSLAQEVSVSRAAVVRFARKLGYSGFAEFRDGARRALKEMQESPLSRVTSDDPATLLERKMTQDSRNLAVTLGLVRTAMEPAARAIVAARRVGILGARNSLGMAVHVHRQLAGLRGEVRLIDPGYPDEAARIGAGDVVVAVLFRRYSRLSIEILTQARDQGATLIVVTDSRGHDFAADADHVLLAATTGVSVYDSMVAPICVLESLVAEVAALDPAGSRLALETVERFTEDLGLLLG